MVLEGSRFSGFRSTRIRAKSWGSGLGAGVRDAPLELRFTLNDQQRFQFGMW